MSGQKVQKRGWILGGMLATLVTVPACDGLFTEFAAAIASLELSHSSAQLEVGEVLDLAATVLDSEGNVVESAAIEWSSRDAQVASVSTAGRVEGLSEGTTVVLARLEDQRDSATVTVYRPGTPPPAPPPPSGDGLLFYSDWGTAVGATDAAMSDGGKWDNLVCNGTLRSRVLQVISGSEIGWTVTPNVLQVTNRGEMNCGMVETQQSVPAGIDFYIRMYIRVEDENQPNFHPVDLNCCGAIEAPLWAIFDPVAGVDYNAKFTFETPEGSQYRRWRPQDKLAQGVWYRFEWHVEFVDVGQRRARIWPRVYDMAGTLLYDASAYEGIDQSSLTLQEFYDQGGLVSFNDLNMARRFALGYEGTGGASDTGRRWFYAAVEIRSDTWPGAVGN